MDYAIEVKSLRNDMGKRKNGIFRLSMLLELLRSKLITKKIESIGTN